MELAIHAITLISGINSIIKHRSILMMTDSESESVKMQSDILIL